MKNFVLFMVIVVNLCLNGCMGGSKKPDNFPSLVPFNLVITKNNVPLQRAEIKLVNGTNSDMVTGGTTDEQGIARLKTVRGSYSQWGAPMGEYKVLVTPPPLNSELSEEEVENLSPLESEAYIKKLAENKKKAKPEIAVKYSLESSTPLSVTVKKNGSQSFDLSAN